MIQLSLSWRSALHWVLWLVFLGSIFILGLSVHLGDSSNLIVSDGNGYYAWVRSLIIDGDWDFRNDFELLYAPDPTPPLIITPKNLIHNKYPIGLAILEIPGFLLGHCFALLFGLPPDGISLPYQVAVTISLTAFIVRSYDLFYQALINFRVKVPIAFIITVSSLIATNLIHYYAKQPTMAHGSGVAVLNILIWLGSPKNFYYNSEKKRSVFTGFFTGLLLLIRNTNGVFLPLIAILHFNYLKKGRNFFYFGITVFSFYLLQQITLFILWGKWVTNPYKHETFKQGIEGLWNVLWGNSYGLFAYHPLYLLFVLLNIVGLWTLGRHRKYCVTILIAFVGLTVINGLWGNFGDSFGHRAFIEALPALGFGAALTLQSFPFSLTQIKQGLGLLILLSGVNLYLWAGYLLHRYPHNGDRTLTQVYLWFLGGQG